MQIRTLEIVSLILRESCTRYRVDRRPEPELLMEAEPSVEAFHAEGSTDGALLPLYHFNALAMSRLLPSGSVVVDLGCGSGQYLRYLARCRPDVRFIGIDLSEAMIRMGNRGARRENSAGNVSFVLGDMTHFRDLIPSHVDAISCVFALHHLRGIEELQRCFREIAAVRSQTGCAVWMFDHVRPRHPRTIEEFPIIFTPKASAAFRMDSRNSLEAAFTFEELSRESDLSLPGLSHECSRWLRLYQIHWQQGAHAKVHDGHARWVQPVLSEKATGEFLQFRHLFRISKQMV